MKSLLRRSQTARESSERIRAGMLFVGIPCHAVEVQGRAIDLTATEFKLLTMLAQCRGRVHSRE